MSTEITGYNAVPNVEEPLSTSAPYVIKNDKANWKQVDEKGDVWGYRRHIAIYLRTDKASIWEVFRMYLSDDDRTLFMGPPPRTIEEANYMFGSVLPDYVLQEGK